MEHPYKETEKIYAIQCSGYGTIEDSKMLLQIAVMTKKGSIERIKNVSSVVDKKFIADLIDHLQESLDKLKGGDMK